MSHRVRRLAASVGIVVTAVAVAMSLAPGISEAGQDDTLCTPAPGRVEIPASFVVDACFDGTDLILRNRQEIVMRVETTGSTGEPVRTPDGTPSAAATLVERAHGNEPNLLPPGYQLRIPIKDQSANIELFGVRDYQSEYVLTRTFLASFLPADSLLRMYEDVSALNRGLVAATTGVRSCLDRARGYWSQVACKAGHADDAVTPFAVFAAQQVKYVPNTKIRASALLSFLDTAAWVDAAVGDFGDFVTGARTLEIAASENPEGPPSADPSEEPRLLTPSTVRAGSRLDIEIAGCPPVYLAGTMNYIYRMKLMDNEGNWIQSDGEWLGGGGTITGGRVSFQLEAKHAPGTYTLDTFCAINWEWRITRQFKPIQITIVGSAPTVNVTPQTIKAGESITVTPNEPCPADGVSISIDAERHAYPVSNETITTEAGGKWKYTTIPPDKGYRNRSDGTLLIVTATCGNGQEYAGSTFTITHDPVDTTVTEPRAPSAASANDLTSQRNTRTATPTAEPATPAADPASSDSQPEIERSR